jgi:hypothetical protein
MYPDERRQPSLLNLLLTVVIAVLVIGYGMIALSTEDALWFWPYFEAEPAEIYIHCYGETQVVSPSDNAFAALTAAVNDMLSGRKRWDPLTMSELTYTEYTGHSNAFTVELRYQPAARVHSFYRYYKNLDTLIIPVDARHARWNATFGRLGEETLAGSLMVESKTALMDSLAASGMCPVRDVSTLPQVNELQ